MPAVSPTPTAREIDKQEAFPWNYGSLLQTGLVDEATGDEGFNSSRGGRRRTACSVTEHSTAQQPGERAHTHSNAHTRTLYTEDESTALAPAPAECSEQHLFLRSSQQDCTPVRSASSTVFAIQQHSSCFVQQHKGGFDLPVVEASSRMLLETLVCPNHVA